MHIHDIDPVTYRCRICGMDELVLILREFGFDPKAIQEFGDADEFRARSADPPDQP